MVTCAYLPYAGKPYSFGPDHDELLTYRTKKEPIGATSAPSSSAPAAPAYAPPTSAATSLDTTGFPDEEPLHSTPPGDFEVSVDDAQSMLGPYNFKDNLQERLDNISAGDMMSMIFIRRAIEKHSSGRLMTLLDKLGLPESDYRDLCHSDLVDLLIVHVVG